MFLIANQDRYLRRFTKAGATSALAATTLDAVGGRDSRVFRRLARRGVFAEPAPGRFYVDTAAATEFLVRRRHQAIIALAIAASALALAVLAGGLP